MLSGIYKGCGSFHQLLGVFAVDDPVSCCIWSAAVSGQLLYLVSFCNWSASVTGQLLPYLISVKEEYIGCTYDKPANRRFKGGENIQYPSAIHFLRASESFL